MLVFGHYECFEIDSNPWDAEAVERIRARAELDYQKMTHIARLTNQHKPQFYQISPYLNDSDIETLVKHAKQLEDMCEQLETRIIIEEEQTDSLKEKIAELKATNVTHFFFDLIISCHYFVHYSRFYRKNFLMMWTFLTMQRRDLEDWTLLKILR